MKYLLTFLSLLSIAYGQTSLDLIYWSETTKLEWKDFKGKPGNSPTHMAVTSQGPQIDFDLNNDTLTITCRNAFKRNESWVKGGTQPPSTLEHEQLHFDIGEVLARRIKKAFVEKGQFRRKTAEQEAAAIVNAQYGLSMADQNLFDQQTYAVLAKQNDWKIKVAQELKALEAYKMPVVKLKVVD